MVKICIINWANLIFRWSFSNNIHISHKIHKNKLVTIVTTNNKLIYCMQITKSTIKPIVNTKALIPKYIYTVRLCCCATGVV